MPTKIGIHDQPQHARRTATATQVTVAPSAEVPADPSQPVLASPAAAKDTDQMAAMLQAIPIVARGGGKKWLGTFQKRQAAERITQNLKKPGTTRGPGLTRRPNGQPGRRRRTTGLDLIASSHLAGSQFLTRIFLDSAPDFAQYSLYRNRWAKSLLQTVLQK